jgi:hypothetical protein
MSSDTSNLTEGNAPAQEKEIPRGKADRLIQWRRDKVWELRACGKTFDEIVEELKPKPSIKISHGTVARDLSAKQREIKEGFKHYIEEELPVQHNLAVTGLDKVIKEAWNIYEKADDQKSALAALNVISDATMKKQAVLGDPAQIERALKAVARFRQVGASK